VQGSVNRREVYVIRELAYFVVTDPAGFEAAMGASSALLAEADGYHGHRLRRGIDQPERYILEVDWDSVQHHVDWKGRHLDAFLAALRPFMASGPEVHYYS
jgi:heme-degrading monooxygenase HmoA